MPRLVHVYIPNDSIDIQSQLCTYLQESRYTHGLSSYVGDKDTLYVFRADNKYVRIIVQELATFGIGEQHGIVDILPLHGTKPRITSRKTSNKKEYRFEYPNGVLICRITDRIPTEEIFETVDGQLHLTFDFLAFIAIASIIAAIGLLTDSAVVSERGK